VKRFELKLVATFELEKLIPNPILRDQKLQLNAFTSYLILKVLVFLPDLFWYFYDNMMIWNLPTRARLLVENGLK
jgi:hypothetical protein